MTKRSILTGESPNIIIKAGGSVTVTGAGSERVVAETKDRRGLSIETRRLTEFARARAAIGEQVLFDMRFNWPSRKAKDASDEWIEITISGDGEVLVPTGTALKVYAGKNIDVQSIRGPVDAYASAGLKLQGVEILGHATSGKSMDLDCLSISGEQAEYKAGGDLRFHIHEMSSAQMRVKDIGGYWEGRIGSGERSVYLKSGGDVTVVTDQAVEALPPSYILGNILKPAEES